VTSGRVAVDAREFIDVDLNTRNLHARGDVKTVNSGEPGRGRGAGSGRPQGLFNASDVMYGFGSEFWYEGGERARYRGTAGTPARLTQGETMVVGQSIDLAQETQDLTAGGGVESTFLVANRETPNAAPQKYRVQADTLEYRNSARTASYAGSPVVLTAPDGVTRAQTMVLTLAPGSQTLDRLDARTDVHSVLPLGREARADSLLYEAATGRYTLRGLPGQPLVLRSEGNTPGSCSESRGLMVHFTIGGGPPVFPPEENRGPVTRREVPCAGPLQK